MSNFKFLVLLIIVFMTGCQSSQSIKTTDPDMPDNAYLTGSKDVGLVLCHGRGHYPTWMVVEPLRKGVNKQLGYHTLSIQMPTGDVSWRDYVHYFPDARKRIDTAIKALKEKGVKKIYLMGHSMGTRMATSYLAKKPDASVAGFIGVGIRTYGEGDLNTTENLRMINIPVLDVFGDGGDGKDADHAADHEVFVGADYKQILIQGADHRFTESNHEKKMVDVIVAWLKTQSED